MVRVVTLTTIGAVAVALSLQAIGAPTVQGSNEPRAFLRGTLPGDQLPSTYGLDRLGGRLGRVTTSRRVATLTRRTGLHATLYMFKTSTGMTCQAMLTKGAGIGCNPSPFFRKRARVFPASGSGLYSGVAADEVARVVLVRAEAQRVRLSLSPDNGFIFDCRPYDVHNGCLCVVAGLDAYAAGGRRLYHQRSLPRLCSRSKR
jgi:hypothetical protein